MTARKVVLSACHETTELLVPDLSDDQAAALERVALMSQGASEYECMPRMTVTEPEPDPADLIEGVPF